MDMREHAESLSKQAFRVLPLHWPIFVIGEPVKCSCGHGDCKSIGKHPLNHNGATGASSDLDQIRQWWERWPTANIGVATGYSDSVDVVDIDSDEGRLLWVEYCARFGAPTQVAVVETGRGCHYYVTPGGQQSWTGGFGGHPKGLDVKGVGGYVVAPPSMHASGKPYRWEVEPGPVTGATPWAEQHRAVVASLVSHELEIRQPGGGHPSTGRTFDRAVIERISKDVADAPSGSRWQVFSTVGIFDFARAVAGETVTENEAISILEDLGNDLGIDSREIQRAARELKKAIPRVHTPIKASAESASATADVSALSVSEFEAELARRVLLKKVDLIVYERAKEQIRREQHAGFSFAEPLGLGELLQRPTSYTQYRIEQLWPIDSRIMLAAQFKVGKTTMVGNVIRALADSSKFLSKYQANAPDGTIALFDTEMATGQLQNWLRAQAVARQEKIWVVPMQGHLTSFDITDDLIREHWVRQLTKRDTEILILDCLAPVLAAIGMDESNNIDVGRFINAFESLLSEARIREALLVHHMGHFGERARGASRLRDWPAAEWHMIREGQEDEHSPAPDVPRYFRAYGRDVDVREQLLEYDPNFRWFSVNGEGNRAEVRNQRLIASVVDVVRTNPGISVRGIQTLVPGKQENVRGAVKQAILDEQIKCVDGPRNSLLHYINE